jgi:hypothetical protein
MELLHIHIAEVIPKELRRTTFHTSTYIDTSTTLNILPFHHRFLMLTRDNYNIQHYNTPIKMLNYRSIL